MRCNFFRRILALFLIGTMLSYVGCKNYDDDIDAVRKDLTESTSALTSQLTTLQNALKSAQETASSALERVQTAESAAQAASDKAEAAGKAAEAAAAAAEKAVADAKAEAIQEAIAACEKLIEEQGSLTADALQTQYDNLLTKIEGVEKDLGEELKAYATVEETDKLTQALEIQKKALENYETELDQLGVDLDDYKVELDQLGVALGDKLSVADLKGKVDQLIEESLNGGTIGEALEKAVKELNDELVKKINSNVSSLNGVFSARLTSVTLVPDLYVDGVPTIEFLSLSYNSVFGINKDGTLARSEKATIVSDESTTAKYRLNPTGVQKGDIELPSFVSTTAVTRSTTGENTPVKVVDYNIENGILVVSAAKTVTESLNLSGNKIYTVSLKVPIQKDHLLADETEAYVYSEYAGLSEQTITPSIAAAYDKAADVTDFMCDKTGHYHFYDSIAVYNEANMGKYISKYLKYTEKFDLQNMVTACYEKDGEVYEMTADRLSNFGLAFQFDLASEEYKLGTNQTDQQKFAQIEGSVISSVVPGGYSDNAAAVDKEPIVRVSLIDTNNGNAVVDMTYFKIKWQKITVNPDPIDLGEFDFGEKALGCDTIKNFFTWENMTEYVYAVLKEKAGISKEEFDATYVLKQNPDGTYAGPNDNGELVPSPSDQAEDAFALTWVLDAKAIGTIVPAESKDYQFTVTYVDPDGVNGDVTITFRCTVSINMWPKLNGFYEQYWVNAGVLANVYPIQYNTPNAQSTCVYDYNLMQLFTPGMCLVQNLLPCGTWDMQFAASQPVTGYAPAFVGEPAGADDPSGYLLKKGLDSAASITFSTTPNWYGSEVDDADAFISLVKNDAGKGLIDKEATLKVWANINGYNQVEVGAFNVKFVAPLKINAELTDAEFYDHVISGSKIDCSKAFTMTDFNNYIVAEVTTNTSDEKHKYAAELWKYYEVQGIEWETKTAKIGMRKDGGDIVIDDALEAEESLYLSDVYAEASVSSVGDELIFTNNAAGAGVEKPCNLFIKAKVTYGWGETSQWVKIRLNPNR